MQEQPEPRYIRWQKYDRRVAWGDDWAGDAWLDVETGEIVYGGVGFDKNTGIDAQGRKLRGGDDA